MCVCVCVCHSMCLELPFLPLQKGVTRASALASLLRVTTSAQVTRHMCKPSQQNKPWCHWNIVWWYPNDIRDFRWWHLHQYWKGIKGRCMRGSGFQVLSFEFIEPSYPPQEYFSASQHWVSKGFLHPSEVMCLGLCFIMVVCFKSIGHQLSSIFITWVTAKLASPATKTGVPNNKDCLPFWCQ